MRYLFEPFYINKKYRSLEKARRREVYKITIRKNIVFRLIIGIFLMFSGTKLIHVFYGPDHSSLTLMAFFIAVLITHHVSFLFFDNKFLNEHIA